MMILRHIHNIRLIRIRSQPNYIEVLFVVVVVVNTVFVVFIVFVADHNGFSYGQ